jgi:hypothetical protein
MDALIDVDSTLWNFNSVIHKMHKDLGHNIPEVIFWNNYDYYKPYITDEEFYGIVHEIHLKQDLFSPFPDAAKFLKNLRLWGYNIVIATHREEDTMSPLKRWLKSYNLIYDDIHVSWDKTELFNDSDLLIDDNPKLLLEAYEKYSLPCSGLLWPWNKSLSNIIPLYKSLTEIFENFVVKLDY